MTAPQWSLQAEIDKREQRVMRRLTRTGMPFAFLRERRYAIFDVALQQELDAIYRETSEGKARFSR